MMRLLHLPITRWLIGTATLIPLYFGSQWLTQEATASLPRMTRQIFTIPLSCLLVTAVMVVAYRLYYRLVEHKPFREFLPVHAVRDIGCGLLFTSLFSGVILSVLLFRKELIVEQGFHWEYLPKVLALAVMSATCEEIVFRGLLFRLTEEKWGSVWAVAISSLLFGLSHFANPHATIPGAISIGLEASLALSAMYMLTRTLWLVIAAHALWNFVQGFLSLPVSGEPVRGVVSSRLSGDPFWTGGSFGIEFSVLTIGLGITVGIFLLYIVYRRGLSLDG